MGKKDQTQVELEKLEILSKIETLEILFNLLDEFGTKSDEDNVGEMTQLAGDAFQIMGFEDGSDQIARTAKKTKEHQKYRIKILLHENVVRYVAAEMNKIQSSTERRDADYKNQLLKLIDHPTLGPKMDSTIQIIFKELYYSTKTILRSTGEFLVKQAKIRCDRCRMFFRSCILFCVCGIDTQYYLE